MIALWKHECTRVIADRFTCLEDKEWFENNINTLLGEVLGDSVEIHPEPIFVDFMREAPEPTGEEDEDADLEAPKVYEQAESKIAYRRPRNIRFCVKNRNFDRKLHFIRAKFRGIRRII